MRDPVSGRPRRWAGRIVGSRVVPARVLAMSWPVLVLVLVLVLYAGSGCSAPDTFDRAAAVDSAMRQDPRLGRSQAECYVDRVVAELGSGALGDEILVEQIPRRTSIRVDCIGVANLGTAPLGTLPQPVDDDPGVTEPRRPGQDAVLDELYAACGEGNGAACDTLFDRAPVGSEYEEFASTCGGRTKETRCADRYPPRN